MGTRVQIISTDFDGTLHAEFETPPVPAGLQKLILSLQQEGAKWVINTGRDLPFLQEGLAAAQISIKPDFVVTVEREIHVRKPSGFVSHDDWNYKCAIAHEEVFERTRKDLPRLVDWINERFEAGVFEDTYSPFCLIARNNEDMNVMQAYLEGYCATVPQLTAVRNDVYLRFSHTGFNKGTALAEITRLCGLSSDSVFAAGDHHNDLPMLSSKHARWLVAPSNAVAAVREAVRVQNGFVSDRPWGHGVEEGLNLALSGV